MIRSQLLGNLGAPVPAEGAAGCGHGQGEWAKLLGAQPRLRKGVLTPTGNRELLRSAHERLEPRGKWLRGRGRAEGGRGVGAAGRAESLAEGGGRRGRRGAPRGCNRGPCAGRPGAICSRGRRAAAPRAGDGHKGGAGGGGPGRGCGTMAAPSPPAPAPATRPGRAPGKAGRRRSLLAAAVGRRRHGVGRVRSRRAPRRGRGAGRGALQPGVLTPPSTLSLSITTRRFRA
ncbi:hypothetical protein LEMLEM_LOCUS5293 [Lemmus lemmus]